MNWLPDNVDLAIVTAMDDELKPVLELAAEWTPFNLHKFPHYYAEIEFGDIKLGVVACSLWKYGHLPTAGAFYRLSAISPKLIVMTGICAGWKKKDIELGDVIIATRAFNPDEGKLTSKGMLPETDPSRPKAWLIKHLQIFENNTAWDSEISSPRPRSLRYQADLVLCKMADDQNPLSQNKSVMELIKTKSIDGVLVRDWLKAKKYLTQKERLTKAAYERIAEIRLQNGGELSPIPDRALPKVHFGTFASGQAVIAVEEKFSEYEQRIRSVRAIEMEVAALYQAADEFDEILVFAVKGVSDHATQDKDDLFRHYAAEVSVRWVFAFIRENWKNIVSTSGHSNIQPDSSDNEDRSEKPFATVEIPGEFHRANIYHLYVAQQGIPPAIQEQISQLQTKVQTLESEIARLHDVFETISKTNQKKVLLITIVELETQITLNLVQQEYEGEIKRVHSNFGTYYDLGLIGNNHLFLVQTRVGGSIPASNMVALLRLLSPSATIMVGLAGGTNSHSQNIGDVIITSSILSFGVEQVKNSDSENSFFNLRAHEILASPRLAQLFSSYGILWKDSKVQTGRVTAGLISQSELAEQLRRYYDRSIGAVFEATGLFAAQADSVEWIAIQGISDFLDNTKRESNTRDRAMTNALHFLFQVLKQVSL